MFAKDKVTQAMIDAVKSVLGEDKKLLLEPGKSEKVASPTGTKVYGHRYGNSAKARKDQTAHEIDKIKGPKDSEVKEELKSETFEFHLTEGSYADLHKKWGDTHNIEYHSHTLYPKHTVTKFDNEKDAESHAKKTGGTVRMNVSPKMKNEELKGNQDKIDANHNDKIDAQDFKILRGKKKVKEGMEFANKLLSSIHEKKDVVMPEEIRKSDVPAYLRKAKGDTPLTVADVKGPKKDTISAPENLAKARNEEVELHEDNLDSIAKKHGMELNRTTYGAGMKHPTKGEISINRYGEWNHKGSKASGDSTDKFSSLDKHLSAIKEETSLSEKLDPKSKTLDTLLGRKKVPAAYDNEHTSPKVKLEAEESVQEGAFKQMDIDRQDRESALEKDGWKKMPANVTDKSGAKHTPMSRAKDLARSAFKKLKTETLMGKAGTTSESKKKW